MPRGVRITEAQKNEIIRLTKEGYKQQEIGVRLGLSSKTVERIQKDNCLRASNRWHFGEEALDENMRRANVVTTNDEVKTVSAPEAIHKAIPEKPTKKCEQKLVAVTNKAIKLTGEQTKFVYDLKFDDDFLTIESGYDEPFKIDLKDLVPFGNELLAVAQEIARMSIG